MPAPSDLAARIQIVAAAVLFSTGGAVIKSTGLDGWQVACFRSGTAALTLLLLIPAARRRPGGRIVAVAAAYAATLVLFVLATKNTTAANAIFLQSTAPIYVVFLSPWLLREPARGRDLLFLAVLLAGLVLILAGRADPQRTAPAPWIGNLQGFLTGIAWAWTLVGLRALGRRATDEGSGAATAVVVGNLLACLATLPWALPVRGAEPRDLLVVGYLGVVQIGLAYVLLTRGLRRVGAVTATLLLFVEPVLNPVWAFLVHGERPGGLALVGGVVILSGTFAKNLLDLGRPRPVG